MMGGMRSKHVEEFNVICVNEQENLCIKLVIIKKVKLQLEIRYFQSFQTNTRVTKIKLSHLQSKFL